MEQPPPPPPKKKEKKETQTHTMETTTYSPPLERTAVETAGGKGYILLANSSYYVLLL